jgi:hypothetical protein
LVKGKLALVSSVGRARARHLLQINTVEIAAERRESGILALRAFTATEMGKILAKIS